MDLYIYKGFVEKLEEADKMASKPSNLLVAIKAIIAASEKEADKRGNTFEVPSERKDALHWKAFMTLDEQIVILDEYGTKHMAAHSEVTDKIIEEAVGCLKLGNAAFGFNTVELLHVVGVNRCVTTEGRPAPQMLYRANRTGKTPCYIGTEFAEPTKEVTLGIIPHINLLFTAFIGPSAPREPWDPALAVPGREAEKAEAEKFWATHAVCMDEDQIDWERSKD